MAIRPAGDGDVESIRALVERAYGRWVPLIGPAAHADGRRLFARVFMRKQVTALPAEG